MKKLLVLHFKGGVSVSGTGSGCGSRVVASLERENAIALLKLLTLSEKDKAEGRVFSKDQLLDGLAD